AVTTPDGGTRPIPIALVPVVLDAGELRRRQRLAAHLSSAGLKMARAALAHPALRARLLGALSPLEAELAALRPVTLLATTRVDFLEGATLQALELNATIPAMQGYSDIAAQAFFDVVGAAAGASEPTIARWRAANGSNARALFDALCAGYARVRPGRAPTRAALLCRRHDAQLSELCHLRDRVRSFGLDADIVYPDQLADDDEAVRVGELRYDLVYRHLFVRRLEEQGFAGAAAARRLLLEENGRRAVVLNPAASHVEVKAVFALLSSSVEDDALAAHAGLTDEERAAIAVTVPWTRALADDGVLALVVADPDRFVLKRAWDYGGRAVFIGRDRTEPGFAERVRVAWPDADTSWASTCARAAADPRGGGFVVQELVEATPGPNLLCDPRGVTPAALTVDFSAYASVGLDVEPPWGAVCRGAPSRIVNIVGGGGVVPVLRADVARELAAALATGPDAQAP
ncbi:MAG: hypothetical protein A2138_20405, partial [Deltaproteobacteria bacterium RBG_16_71_12]